MGRKRLWRLAADAAAICKALTRPRMRIVPTKSADQVLQDRLFGRSYPFATMRRMSALCAFETFEATSSPDAKQSF
jgi:hypothetical protein